MARTLAPGEVITQQDWLRFQEETGGKFRSTQIRPPTKAEIESGKDYEQDPIYRYYLADGQSYVEMQQNEKGDYTVVDFKPSAELAKQTTATAPTGPPGGKPYIDEGPEAGATGQRLGWNPDTRAYDRPLGPSPAAQTQAAGPSSTTTTDTGGVKTTVKKVGDEVVETATGPGTKPPENKWSPAYKNKEGNLVQSETDPNGALTGNVRAVPDTAAPADKDKKQYVEVRQDPNTGKWHGLSADGNWEEMQGGPGVKPVAPVTAPAGEARVQMVPDPDNPGQLIAKPIPGTEKKDTALPSVDLTQATMGKYTDALKKLWDETYAPAVNAGTLTMPDALKQFEVQQKMAEAKANEEIAQLNAQQNIRGQDISQRGQTLGEVANQRTNLQNTMQTALQVVKPADFGKYTPGAIKEIVDMYGGMQDKFGIPKGVPSPQPYTPQQQQVMGAAGPAPIVFNINTGGAVPTSMPNATLGTQMGLPGGVPETPGMADMSQPPQNPEQILDEMRRNSPDQFWNDAVDRVGGNLQAAREKAAGGVAAGMSLSGGQLRAPGMGPVGAGPVGQVG